MDNVKKLLDEVKTHCERPTDYAVAKKLDLHRGLICDYYKGNRVPDEFACLQIAKELGKPFEEVLATVKADTEKNEKRRLVWQNYLKQMGGIAAGIFVAVIFIVSPTPSEAAPALKSMTGTFCIM